MRRRALLTSLAAGAASLAGCATNDGGGTPTGTTTSGTTTGTPTETPASDHTPDDLDLSNLGSVVEAETTPRTYALFPTRYRSDDDAEVELAFTSTATAEHPARMRATLTNENEFANTFRLRQTPPFGPRNLAFSIEAPDPSHRQSLVLAPTENHGFADAVPEVRRDAQGYWRLRAEGGEWVPKTLRLAPGETVHAEYALVGRREGQGRPTGTYSSHGDEERVSITVWHTEKPGPSEGSRFENPDVVPVTDDQQTQWFHDADETTPSFLRPGTERADLPTEVEFTFVNHTKSALGCGGWNLYKFHDGEWFHLAPRFHLAICRRLAPGATESWTLRAFHGEAIPCDDGLSAGFLGGGRYAVTVGYGHRTGLSGALVDLDGPPVDVTPTADVTSTREGETVTVTSSKWDDGQEPPNARLVVEDTGGDAVGAATEFIPEQVMRPHNRGLRNTLAFFEEGVRKVVLRTDENTAKGAFVSGEPRHFAFQGNVYDATLES